MTATKNHNFLNVLLLDEDEDDYRFTRDFFRELSDEQLQLDWISDFDEANAVISQQAHDLYLVDYRLGKSNGLELIRRANDRDCTVPILLLTGRGEGGLDPSTVETNGADFLEKGMLNASILERAIRYTLHQKRHSEQLECKVRERTAELARTNGILHAEIAERKRAESALRDADRRKDEFLATLAHELRNPLAPICNALEILRIAGDRPDIRESHRAMIERQVGQMVRLIDDLLDLSRISRGKIQLRMETVELGSIIARVIESIQPVIDKAKHSLTVIPPHSELMLRADPTRLAQILLNLLQNACKYTEPGGQIRLQVDAEGAEVCIRVKDNGIGISADQLPNLFQMFTQLQPPIDQSRGGLGIGLSLVQSLVTLHGGSVDVRSDGPGLGSEFIVRMPIDG